MPPLTRWFVKTALVYFVLALLVGFLLAAQSTLNLRLAFVAGLFPVYFHLLAEGWITMLIIGVAIWMFPKYSTEQPRGNERLGRACYFLLNIGLALRILAEPMNTQYPGLIWGWLLVLSALLQLIGGFAFVVAAWARVKEK